MQWRDDQPIYRQLYGRMIDLIMCGQLAAGEGLPSVRQVSADFKINHLTVAKAYQALVDEGLVEKRRGVGMYVLEGAREHLLEREREQFIQSLPALVERAAALGIGLDALVQALQKAREEQ
ncbi:GntR family transcriptional regulator [Gilvimarinus sp. SDUM040013]|uniref:GntR family transcriptional regulator n=1 Tax=Gilvimarinus gilvus TaxID=3058038 RepID=A0ABU4RXE8_9GAMM|nr:GntR family transcriptional regulator [Gilvimarinus sp. SDUM040013]MDO3388672.1 GntR family transcriptional regulator [Gilvimarinus sp. SDUM040013]MDX6849567.1 GntR family transcriptional regulator [Gilvimarinus sp. SDUM040013]